ncbi:hypothetical protein [Saccharopolyspora endophytica]|uniref:Uncharacterized protein n=1 Tax=Saccharopolyspora endophytica TaxID=543886 RepID=A0ABS5DRC0_9PSEU|nr:hypothetical protein [Saccharopolyspora endophytica]MBQ0928832.1 hypothetical protein [Saccharopolyspora endophytica]
MGKSNPWHTIVKKSWWDGSMITLCGQKIPSGKGESDFWYLPRTGPDCPTCEALKTGK